MFVLATLVAMHVCIYFIKKGCFCGNNCENVGIILRIIIGELKSIIDLSLSARARGPIQGSGHARLGMFTVKLLGYVAKLSETNIS